MTSERRWALAFAEHKLVLVTEGNALRLPTVTELAEALGQELEEHEIPSPIRFAGDGAAHAFALPIDASLPEGYAVEGLRVAYHALSEAEFRAAGTARQKVEWYRTHRFCSVCGGQNVISEEHDAMACPACGQLHFPRVAPAVIVLVQREHEALLARSPRFPENVYSTLAGFVEPGESLEECIHREIHEEVGVEVNNLRYFGSQPHPFPHSLMVGFVADWADGDIVCDPREISDARWFTADDLPGLPHPMSIARALIEDFVQRVRS